MMSAGLEVSSSWISDYRADVTHDLDASRQRLMKAFLDMRPALLAYVRTRVAADIDPDDVVQDIATRLMSGEDKDLAGIENFAAYMFTVAGNVLKDRYRHGAVRARKAHVPIYDLTLSDNMPSPEDRVEARMRLQRLNRQIEALPEDMRESFILYKVKGKTLHETAEAQGVPVYKVRKNLERALARLSRKVWSD